MKHFKPINKKSRDTLAKAAPDAFGHACAACCASFAPGWEVGPSGNVDPCPWQNDLNLCWVTCFWIRKEPRWLIGYRREAIIPPLLGNGI